MLADCSVSNSSPATVQDLEPIGVFTYEMVRQLGNRIRSIEPGNEINWNLGSKPFAQPGLWYRNMCHVYAGAKKANPNIIVYAGSCAATLPAPSFPSSDDWYHLLKLERTTNQPNYFSNLKSALGFASRGPDPMDVINIHTYPPDPGRIATGTFMDRTVNAYNDFGGQYPVAFTEMGPSNAWESEPNATAAAGWGWEAIYDWLDEMFGYLTGNRRWDHQQFTGSDGADLSGTNLAARKAAARNIFELSYYFNLRVNPSDGHHALGLSLYDGPGGSTDRRFIVGNATRDAGRYFINFPAP
jgi:hypothetical protein